MSPFFSSLFGSFICHKPVYVLFRAAQKVTQLLQRKKSSNVFTECREIVIFVETLIKGFCLNFVASLRLFQGEQKYYLWFMK